MGLTTLVHLELQKVLQKTTLILHDVLTVRDNAVQMHNNFCSGPLLSSEEEKFINFKNSDLQPPLLCRLLTLGSLLFVAASSYVVRRLAGFWVRSLRFYLQGVTGLAPQETTLTRYKQ
jgi:hypothetical protein